MHKTLRRKRIGVCLENCFFLWGGVGWGGVAGEGRGGGRSSWCSIGMVQTSLFQELLAVAWAPGDVNEDFL